MGPRPAAILAVLALLLGALVAVELKLGIPRHAPIEERAPELPDLSAAAHSSASETLVPPLAALSETVARPLFSPDRRPEADEPVEVTDLPAVEPVAGPPPSFTLSAVVIRDGERIALLGQGGGDVTRVREGESVEGWTLSEVRSDGVTLTQGVRSHEVTLRTFSAPQPRSPGASGSRRATSSEAGSGADQRTRRPLTRRSERLRRRQPQRN